MIVLLLLLLLPLSIALMTYAFFWYETANSPHREYLENLSDGRPGRLLIRGILSSYVSFLLTILFYPTGLWRRLWRPEPHSDCPLPPIILVHGLYHNVSAWTLYRRWLKAAGFANITVMGYSSWNQTFDQLVKQLDQVIAEAQQRFPGKHPVLIGHSLGGLVSRACLQSLGNSAPIAGVITLGTPHQGSKLAALGLGKLAKTIIYHSPLIKELEGRKGTPHVPCVALYSPIDNMVLPNHALQTADTGWVHQEVTPISHVTMLYHKKTAELVLQYLKSMCDTQ